MTAHYHVSHSFWAHRSRAWPPDRSRPRSRSHRPARGQRSRQRDAPSAEVHLGVESLVPASVDLKEGWGDGQGRILHSLLVALGEIDEHVFQRVILCRIAQVVVGEVVGAYYFVVPVEDDHVPEIDGPQGPYGLLRHFL